MISVAILQQSHFESRVSWKLHQIESQFFLHKIEKLKIYKKTIISKILMLYSAAQGTGSTVNQSVVKVDRASATEMVGTGSISDRVKSKTRKVGIHGFPA